jgi:hypothetical protein
MRIGLSIILSLLLTLQLSALPNVRTGSLPTWLIPIHPDLQKQPAKNDISDGYYYQLLDLQTSLSGKTRYTSEVSVTFAPEFQQVVFHRITILRNGASLNLAYSVIGFNPVFGNKFSDDFAFSTPFASSP